MRILLPLVILCFISKLAFSQTYCFTWSPGPGINVGFSNLIQAPSVSTVTACSGSDIYFSLRFGDLDQAVCSRGTFLKQFRGADYNITFSTTSGFAAFPNGTNMQIADVSIITRPNPYNPLEKVDIFITNPIALNIKSTWDGTPIIVTATVTEVPVTMPPCHLGSYIDPVYTYSWTINLETGATPTDMVRTDVSPTDNTWTYYPNPNTGLDFTYKALPNAPPAYQNKIVNESFGPVKADGLFYYSDLRPEWKALYPLVLDADQAAPMIFEPGKPVSFDIDASNQFEDYHDGFALDKALIPTIFTVDAINNKRVGYKLDQKYSSCGTELGKTEIWRRIDSSLDVELKKKHSL